MGPNRLTQEQADELNAIFYLNNRGKKKKRELVWESALGACEFGDYLIIPLTSSWALRREGRAMRHCAGSYDTRCAQGQARVFSIRNRRGERIATLSLVSAGNDWYLEQIKGVANEEVCVSDAFHYDGEEIISRVEMTELHYIAYEIARCYRVAWEQSMANNARRTT